MFESSVPWLRALPTATPSPPRWERSDLGKRAKYYRLAVRGRRELSAEQSRWDAFARAMGLVLKPDNQES